MSSQAGRMRNSDAEKRSSFGFCFFCSWRFFTDDLLSVGRRVALHFAANENLRADFRLEGTVFGGLVVRNLHVIPTGPSPVESIDADFVRVDYSLFALVFHGLSSALNNFEVRSASIVLTRAKTCRPNCPGQRSDRNCPGWFPSK